jgi:pilus assembly protein CpaB
MNRRTKGVVAAVALGAIGTFVLVAYVQGAEDRAVAGEKMTKVVIASRSVDAGTAADDLRRATKTERVPQKARGAAAISDLKEVRGLVTTTDLVEGEQLLRTRFAKAGQVRKGVGSVKVPAGYVEITLSLEPERAVGGLIKPGNRVVAIGTLTSSDSEGSAVIAHQVLVTNVQIENKNNEPDQAETKKVAPTRNLLVTVAVDDETATKILAFADNGNVWLGSEQQQLAGASQ